MIIDALNTFANGASVAGSSGATIVIGDVIDLEGLGGGTPAATVGGQRSAGDGQQLFLVVKTTTTVVAADPGSLTIQLVSDSTSNLATSPTVHWSSGALATAAASTGKLAANGIIAVVALPWEGGEYERYLGITGAIATENITGGAIDAFLTFDPTAFKAYPANPSWS